MKMHSAADMGSARSLRRLVVVGVLLLELSATRSFVLHHVTPKKNSKPVGTIANGRRQRAAHPMLALLHQQSQYWQRQQLLHSSLDDNMQQAPFDQHGDGDDHDERDRDGCISADIDPDYQFHTPQCCVRDDDVIVTQTALRHMELEIQLLESLHESDDAIDSLMDLWVQETHQQHSIQRLNEMEIWCSPTLEKEASILEEMIAAQPGWVEPCSRLALLRYYQDRPHDSIELCLEVLDGKPWQFEAAQTLIWSALRVGDWPLAVSTARYDMLPRLSQPKRRKRWIDRSLVEARVSLSQARDLHELQRSNRISISTVIDGAISPADSSAWQ